MNVVVPPSNCALDVIGLSGSRTMAIKPKPVRQGRGGVSPDTRIFAY